MTCRARLLDLRLRLRQTGDGVRPANSGNDQTLRSIIARRFWLTHIA